MNNKFPYPSFKLLTLLFSIYSLSATATHQESKNDKLIHEFLELIHAKVQEFDPMEEPEIEDLIYKVRDIIHENVKKAPLLKARSPEQYLEETKDQDHIMVLGGGRSYYKYPDNAYLANLHSERYKADQPDIDITHPNSIPEVLKGKFDIVIWERVDSQVFFNSETFENIKTALKPGGLFIANDMLYLQNKKDASVTTARGLKEVSKGLWNNMSDQPHHIYYETPPYDDSNLEKVIEDTFNSLFAPVLEKHGFSNIRMVKQTKVWFSDPSESGYIEATKN